MPGGPQEKVCAKFKTQITDVLIMNTRSVLCDIWECFPFLLLDLSSREGTIVSERVTPKRLHSRFVFQHIEAHGYKTSPSLFHSELF